VPLKKGRDFQARGSQAEDPIAWVSWHFS